MGTIQNTINQELGSFAQLAGTKKIVETLDKQQTEGLVKEGKALKDAKFDIDKKDLQLNQTERNLSKAEIDANSIQDKIKGNELKMTVEEKNILQEKYDLAMKKVDELRELREMQMFEHKNRIARFNEDVAAYNKNVSRASALRGKRYKESFPKVDAIEGGKK